MIGLPWYWKLIAVAVIWLSGVALGGVVTHKIDQANYEKLVADYAKAQVAEATKEFEFQKLLDEVETNAVKDRADSAERLNANLQARLAEVEREKSSLMRGCVTYEFMRQLRLYIRDVPGESLALPAGKRGGDCAPVSGLRLGRAIITNLAIGRDNGDRLDKLSAWALKIQAMRPATGDTR